jgi:predicted PurR-regulated permease PerM
VASTERTLRLRVGPEAVAVVLAAAAAAYVAFGVADAARRILGWALACAVVAALIEPAVTLLDRWLPRFLAIAAVLLVVGAASVSVATGVLADVDNQFERLKVEAPRAALELESSPGFGDLARDFRLQQRVGELLARLQDPTSGLAAEVPSRTSTYLICTVLTAFFLSWGPKLGRAALAQLTDEGRKARVQQVAGTTFSRGQGYILATIARAAAAGVLTGILCRVEDVPAPVVMAVTVAALSVIPGFGILAGALPALLLEAGLGEGGGALRLAVAFVVLQVLDEIVLRRVVAPRSLTVGPAAIVIALVVGFEVYGVGGAFYGAALAVFGVALLDAAGD